MPSPDRGCCCDLTWAACWRCRGEALLPVPAKRFLDSELPGATAARARHRLAPTGETPTRRSPQGEVLRCVELE